MNLFSKPKTEQNPDTRLEKAMEKAKKHRLKTDEELLQALDIKRRQYWLSHFKYSLGFLGVASVGIYWAYTGAPAENKEFFWANLKSVAFLIGPVLGIIFLAMALLSWREPRRFYWAKLALKQQDYENRALTGLLAPGWGQSLAPVEPSSWHWRDISQKIQAFPDLAVVWAQWLLGNKPIRGMDVEVLSNVIQAHSEAKDWRVHQESVKNEQAQGRKEALEALPSTLVTQVRSQHLDGVLSSDVPNNRPKVRL